MSDYDERWRPVVEFNGLYEVSDHGRVRSVARVVKANKGMRLVEGRILKPQMKLGYPNVQLCDGGRVAYRLVHRLVAEAFVPGIGEVVRHLDGDPGNPLPSNLAWGSYVDNEADKRRHGRTLYGEKHPNAKATDSDVKAVREMHSRGISQLAIAKHLGIGRGVVGSIVRGEGWRHVK